VTVSITLPLATDEMWLPAAAVVEDGGQSYVFVQPDAKKPIYEQRRVLVVRRGHDAVHVRAKLTPEQERQGVQIVQSGERVITVGALELKAILDDLKAH
jgi:cobalt-zinc-cadmium efflux system membrane fusion protein